MNNTKKSVADAAAVATKIAAKVMAKKAAKQAAAGQAEVEQQAKQAVAVADKATKKEATKEATEQMMSAEDAALAKATKIFRHSKPKSSPMMLRLIVLASALALGAAAPSTLLSSAIGTYSGGKAKATNRTKEAMETLFPLRRITLLYYTGFFGKKPTAPYIETNARCTDTCFVTTDRKYAPTADAFLVHGRDYEKPPTKYADKPWVLQCRENPAYTSVMRNQQEMSKFSYSATARLDSDFPFPSWLGQNFTGGHGPDTLRAVVAFDDRESVPIYATNSNCEPVRTEYQRELMEYVQVDSFGACLHNQVGLTKIYKKNFGADNVARQHRYKFTLVFMNADCDLWVDTRLLNALDAGSVPIFMGTADVDRWLPGMEDSIIKVSDFESPKALATYIKTVAADKALYNTYLQWKTRGVSYRGTEMEAVSSNMGNFYCNLCEKIRSDPKAHPGRVKAEQCTMRKKGGWLPTPKDYDPDKRTIVRLLPASSSATGSPWLGLGLGSAFRFP